VCSRNLHNDQEPPRRSRLVWAFALALLAFGLVVSDNVRVVQTSTVVFSVPVIPVIVLMCVSLIKWLREDFGNAGGN
jgi:BCCT family betaine/carnitine transporter